MNTKKRGRNIEEVKRHGKFTRFRNRFSKRCEIEGFKQTVNKIALSTRFVRVHDDFLFVDTLYDVSGQLIFQASVELNLKPKFQLKLRQLGGSKSLSHQEWDSSV